ncbi:hypothetical protein [Bradyrhizobium sp.]|uniref:hypothetical protein n=1 Tax=Bradyrhizobium sp. TaxID=376 RepID=UPI0025B99D2F|nr:hypothetical protein [Bradyrhizobium sp.]MBV8919663.1 hypothetical protein [Bradyrhizobium sp.]
MSTKTLLTLSATALLGVAVFAPSAALAQLPGPPPGPPPMLAGPPPGLAGPPPGHGAGGPPPGLGARGPLAGPVTGLPPRGPAGAPSRDIAGGAPRLDTAAGLRGLDRGGQANFRGVEARTANYGANGYNSNSYARDGSGQGYRYGRYAAAAAYAYGRSYASSDDGCYYVTAYRRYGYRRVLVCHGD